MEQTKQIEQPHSIKFAINAKGKFSAEIKCYGTTPQEALKNTMQMTEIVEPLILEKNREKEILPQ